jgi:hypothetical protein
MKHLNKDSEIHIKTQHFIFEKCFENVKSK